MDDKLGLGGPARFEFKYVPALHRRTPLGQRRTNTIKRPGLESLGHMGLMLASGAMLTLGVAVVFVARVLPAGSLTQA